MTVFKCFKWPNQNTLPSKIVTYAPTWTLTHWGRETHICVSKLTIIASDNGLSPGRRQAIIWNNAWILSIGLLGTNFSENLIEIFHFFFQENALESVVCEMTSILSRPQCVKRSQFITQVWHREVHWPIVSRARRCTIFLWFGCTPSVPFCPRVPFCPHFPNVYWVTENCLKCATAHVC